MSNRGNFSGNLPVVYSAYGSVLCLLFVLHGFIAGQSVTPIEAANHAKALSQAFRDAANAVVPSVVTVSGRVAQRRGLRATSDEFEDGAIGSGVLIHASGIILTNSHVILGTDRVIVRTNDGREFPVRDIRRDLLSDVALLYLAEPPDLPVARLGDSDQLEIGDWVIAVGSPYELEATVSAGIISGKGRGISKIERGKLLQTDAAINPGNSGGPLVNLDGEVIGMNTAIASSSGGYEGIGFAIPSNEVRWVVEQLYRNGAVQRAGLGVRIGEVSAREAPRYGLASGTGARINNLTENGPAERGGLQINDVIIEFAGAPVTDIRDLQSLVERRPIGSRQTVKVLRDGKPQEFEVVLTDLNETEPR